MTESVDKYNVGARVFHWSIALLILMLLCVGFYMDQMSASPFKFQLYGWHKAFGITVLGLALLRVIWRLSSKTPESLSAHKRWEKMLSKTIHIVLYIAMVAMPLSGWVMSSAGGHAVSFFGLFDMPSIVSENTDLGRMANQAHGLLAYVIIGCVCLHILGALKHHIVDRDATLSRMGGHVLFGVIGLALLAIALFIPIQNTLDGLFEKSAAQVVSVEEFDSSKE